MPRRYLLPLLAVAAIALPARPGAAQTRAAVERERADFAAWLASAPNSPYAAVARLPVGDGLVLGPRGADVPLAGLEEARVVEERGSLWIVSDGSRRQLPRYRATALGGHLLLPTGAPGRSLLTVFGPPKGAKPPSFYPYDPGLAFSGPLRRAEGPRTHRILTLDGAEVDAVEVGSVLVPLGGGARLRVYRVPDPGTEESELVVYFRDETNGRGTYPAGRFVPLVPLADGRYRLDFNRARNPFCAYSTVYPCPAPWPGNAVPAEVRAGERYEGGGLETPEIG